MPPSDKQTYFNNLAARWDEIPRSEDYSAGVRRFVERACAGAAGRILDAGCGTGILLPAILAVCPGARTVIELDFAEAMLRENAKLRDPRAAGCAATTCACLWPVAVSTSFCCSVCCPTCPILNGGWRRRCGCCGREALSRLAT